MINQKSDQEELHVVTHWQQFNLDELFAIVLIQLYVNPNTKITRTRDADLLKNFKADPDVWVLDVGGEYNEELKNFDHHQASFKETWKDGTPKSTCGMVWDFLKKNNLLAQHMNKETIAELEKHIILKVDWEDNGIEKWTEATFINLFNRQTDNEKLAYKQFMKALDSAKEFFKNMFGFVRNNMKAEKEITKILKKSEQHDHVLVFDSNNRAALSKINQYSDKKVAVVPHTSKTQWKVMGVNPKQGQKQALMPTEWRGLMKGELQRVSGINNLEFCHKSGFMCVINSDLESAIKLAQQVAIYNTI